MRLNLKDPPLHSGDLNIGKFYTKRVQKASMEKADGCPEPHWFQTLRPPSFHRGLSPYLGHSKGLFLIWIHTKLKIQGKTLTETYFHNQIEKTFLRLVPRSYLILPASGFLFPFSK